LAAWQAFSWLLAPGSLVFLAVASTAAPAAAADPVTWRTGRDFQKFLEQNIGGAGLHWSGQTFREAVGGWSKLPTVRVAMFIDRRIDPETRLNVAMGDVPFEDALGRVATAGNAEFCQVGSVVYFGPATITKRLRTVVELRKQDIRALPAADGKRFAVLKPLRWDDLAEPRELLRTIAAEAGVTIENVDTVPHDLWAAAELPSLPIADRLSLVAAAFDLTFELGENATTLKLVPIPERVAIKRSYAGGKNADEVAKKLAGVLTGCKVSVTGTRIDVEGRVEDHAIVTQALAGKPVKKPSAAGEAPTGNVALDKLRIDKFVATNQPLGTLIKEIARRLNMEAEFDGPALVAAKVSLDQVISVELASGTIKDLLDKITKPYGLEYEIRDKKLLIRPAAKK
jgi:hypothetical protein